VHIVGWVISPDLVAGIVISLVAFAVSLRLLHQLVTLELDAERADLTVLLIAFCPMAYFFSAVYSESLFMVLSLACILRARSGRWASAALLGALAAAERNSGVMLAVPVTLMYLYGPRTDAGARLSRWAADRGGLARVLPRYAPRPSLLWVALIPLGFCAYIAFLGISAGEASAPFHAQAVWFRSFAGPFGGVWNGAVAAWDGLRQILHGPAPPTYFTQAGGDPLMVAGQNLMEFGFLVLGVIAFVGALRLLPFAYSAYVLASMALPLSYPVSPQPLASLPRYEVVLFPLFMWGATFIARRRLETPAIAALAVLLGLFTVEFATWRFVA
jgi:hypothetical protein